MKGISIKKIKPDSDKVLDVMDKVQQICAQREDIKYLAQRAFISYVKGVYKQQDKTVFDVHKIDFKKLAQSYGLAQAPVIFIGENSLNLKNQNYDQN